MNRPQPTDRDHTDDSPDDDVLRAILNADPLLSFAEAEWFVAMGSDSGVRLDAGHEARGPVGVGA